MFDEVEQNGLLVYLNLRISEIQDGLSDLIFLLERQLPETLMYRLEELDLILTSLNAELYPKPLGIFDGTPVKVQISPAKTQIACHIGQLR